MGLISRKMLKRRPQELGKIKIGGKGAEKGSSSGKTFRQPVKYDHFVVTSRARGQDGNFELDRTIHGHPDVGSHPTSLAGVLMYETPEENFHAEMALYRGRTQKVSTCDGEERVLLGTGERTRCAKLEGKECDCKPYGRLHVQLWASPHVLGYHTFRTTSWESVNNIQTALQEIYERFGSCYQAPIRLVLYPAEKQYQQGGETRVSTSYVVGLVLAMSLEEAAKRMVETRRQLDLTRNELRLVAGEVAADQDRIDLEEAEDISEEFFPDESITASVQTQDTLNGLKAELGVGLDADFQVVGDFRSGEKSPERENDDTSEGPVVQATTWEDEAEATFAGIQGTIQDRNEEEALEVVTKYLRKYLSRVSLETQDFVRSRFGAGDYTLRKATNDLKKVIWEAKELEPRANEPF